MRRVLLLLACVLAAPTAQADEPEPKDRAFVGVTAPRTRCYVHEAVRLRLRLGYDREWFKGHGAPLFHQPTDAPIQVLAPWFADLPGTLPLADPARHAQAVPDRRTVVLNDGVVEAAALPEEIRDGRPFVVLEIERRVAPERAGPLTVGAPSLRFAHADRFEEDFVSGRTPVEPRTETVDGAPLSLEVLPLPAEGRPADFVDAVGRFSLRAQADRTEVAAGETLRLTLRVEGEGNLELLTPPRLDGLPDFHLYGTTDDHGSGVRTVVYHLAPLRAGVSQVPEVPLAYFDPSPPAGYRLVRSAALPLRVHAREGTSPSTAVPANPPAHGAPDDRARRPSALLLVAGVALAASLLVLALRRRAGRRAVVPPEVVRAQAAAESLRTVLGRPGSDPTDAFAELLASHLRCAPAAVIAPDLPSRLAASGLPRDLASRATAAMEALVAARYGGGALAPTPEVLAALASEIQGTGRPTERSA